MARFDATDEATTAALDAVDAATTPERYADQLRLQFSDLGPTVEDLFLLEAHQIADLPARAPARELAAVLHAHPTLQRFFVARHPPIGPFLSRLCREYRPVKGPDLAVCEQSLVWELADWIAYQRAPELYETGAEVDWDLAAVTEIAPMAGKTVVDAGAGTGRVAFAVAPAARHVYAVEPVAALRRFMRDKAARLGHDNLFVLDGYLHAVPLPAHTADVLITCQAIGWNLAGELAEIERVVRPGGFAIHVFGSPAATRAEGPLPTALLSNGYRTGLYEREGVVIRRYWKRINP